MAYIRKTTDEWQLQSYYPAYGWETIVYYDDRKEAKQDLRLYNENEPGIPHRIIKKRIKKEA